MKYSVKITNLSFDIEIEPIGEIPPIDPPVIPPNEQTLTDAEWQSIVQSGTVQLSPDTYRIPNYSEGRLTKDLDLDLNGSTLIFGKDYFNQWRETGEAKNIFNLGKWNNTITIRNGKIDTGKLIDQVEPWYRRIFTNSSEAGQIGTINLINIETTLDRGLLYSGSQSDYLTFNEQNLKFEGIMGVELKSNNGGGLLHRMKDVELKQVDPITFFQAKVNFFDGYVTSNVSFDVIENMFNGFGNSANILYLDDMTFYLPKGLNDNPYQHAIRKIPKSGDVIPMEWTGVYLRSNQYELQIFDSFVFNGVTYRVDVKDRVVGTSFEASGYSNEYALDMTIPIQAQTIQIRVLQSMGANILDGIARSAYMIFKYNKHYQTNVDIDHGLEYMLASNPFGVLSYNHKEITADWENVTHEGYYRQSSSGVGYSNGYRMVNCTGFGDEFNPDVEIVTE